MLRLNRPVRFHYFSETQLLCVRNRPIQISCLRMKLHCVSKSIPLMFDNNFGKCAPILKILSPIDLQENSVFYLFWDPLYISKSNHARKLKFGMLVGICRY